jgi:hypothetical protein
MDAAEDEAPGFHFCRILRKCSANIGDTTKVLPIGSANVGRTYCPSMILKIHKITFFTPAGK